MTTNKANRTIKALIEALAAWLDRHLPRPVEEPAPIPIPVDRRPRR